MRGARLMMPEEGPPGTVSKKGSVLILGEQVGNGQERVFENESGLLACLIC